LVRSCGTRSSGSSRRFIGIDVNPEYREIAEKQLQQGVLF